MRVYRVTTPDGTREVTTDERVVLNAPPQWPIRGMPILAFYRWLSDRGYDGRFAGRRGDPGEGDSVHKRGNPAATLRAPGLPLFPEDA